MDHIFDGTPKDKWLEVIFHASRGLCSGELDALITRCAALEVLLERRLGEGWEAELEYLQNSEECSDEIYRKTQDLAMISMGNILSQNE